MSTDYRPLKPVPFSDLFDGRFARYGVREHTGSMTSDKHRCLTDGRNYVWAYDDGTGLLGGVTRYGPNCPLKILEAIAEEFDARIFDEHQPEYWGFDSQEEMDATHEEIARRHRQEFYEDLLKYVRGEPNGIRAGTIGEIQADIAKDLIAQEPTLVENKEKLIEAVEHVYEERHVTKVTLSKEDIAFVKMCTTLDEDLPQA